MNDETFEQQYLRELDRRAGWYKRTGDRTMAQFIVVRLGLVLISASLPALTTFQARGWATAAAVLVAVLAGLDTQFQWGEEWRHFRSTQYALERARRDYERRKSAISSGNPDSEVTTHEANLATLYAQAEDLLQSETDRFFRFRITSWKAQTPGT